MAHKLLVPAVTFLLLLLLACGGEKGGPDKNQGQVTSPAVADKEPGIEEVPVVDEFPVVANTVKPVYPEEDKKNGVEGKVFLKILVDKEGNVKKAVVTSRTQGSLAMEHAAIEAAKQFTFKPATVKNQPVEIWVSIPFAFKLAEKK